MRKLSEYELKAIEHLKEYKKSKNLFFGYYEFGGVIEKDVLGQLINRDIRGYCENGKEWWYRDGEYHHLKKARKKDIDKWISVCIECIQKGSLKHRIGEDTTERLLYQYTYRKYIDNNI